MEAIKGIIKVQGKNIISFRLNPELVYSLAEDEKEQFESFYDELEKNGITKLDRNLGKSLNILRDVIQKKEEEIRKLKQQAIIVNSDDVFSRKSSDKDDYEVVALQHHINQSSERIRKYLYDLRLALDRNASREIVINYISKANHPAAA